MSATSKPLADLLFNHILRNTSFTAPTTVYLAIHADGGSSPAHPGKTAAAAFGNECDWTSYQRQAITFNAPGGTETAVQTNSNTIAFPEVDASEGPFVVTGISIWTAERGANVGASGTFLFAGPVTAAKELEETDAALFPVGSVEVEIGEELP